MSHLGFGPIWNNLISSLLKTASTCILLNGEPREEIRHQRGLRQGDPLFGREIPSLPSSLNSLFLKASELSLLQPLLLRNSVQRIPLYADDVALFLQAIEEEMNLILEILDRFGAALGLRTNLQKSCVIPITCEEEHTTLINDLLSCPQSEFPSTYLGLPISIRS